jgi:hypothetical protein
MRLSSKWRHRLISATYLDIKPKPTHAVTIWDVTIWEFQEWEVKDSVKRRQTLALQNRFSELEAEAS